MGVFRVHPLIMTLGMGLVVLGLANVWQLQMVQTGAGVSSEMRTLGSDRLFGILPYSLVVFLPVAGAHPGRPAADGLRPPAVRDRRQPGRRPPRPGARAWQVLVALYVISALLAGVAGFLISGLTNVASVTLADSLRPALGRGGGHRRDVDHGRPGWLRRARSSGALILTVLTSLLSALGFPGGGSPDPVRGDHRGRRGGVYAGDGAGLTGRSGPRPGQTAAC